MTRDELAARTAPIVAELLELNPPRPHQHMADCPHCGTAQVPELIAFDGEPPQRICVWLCPGCSRAFRTREDTGELLRGSGIKDRCLPDGPREGAK